MENKKKAEELLTKYVNGTCTAEEKELFETLYNKVTDKEKTHFSNHDLEKIGRALYNRLPQPSHNKTLHQWRRIAAAAIVLLCIGLGLYLYQSKETSHLTNTATVQPNNDIAPGSNKAVLTLADGSNISLTDAKTGEIAQQTGIKILKAEDGELIYTETTDLGPEATINYNTIATPKGGQYKLTLPDGTKVWLNAASSLKYPVHFINTKERIVELEGEAYFEVFSDSKKPFFVHTKKQTLEVLGTHFNINSYENEGQTKTTLLEGSVRLWNIDSPANSTTLKPGEQSTLLPGSSAIRVEATNTASMISWKNGFFQLEDIDIQTFMRQVERWYDVKVTYQGALPQGHFNGKIKRSEHLSKVLEMLSFFNVQFQVNGNRIIVSTSS